MYLYYAAIERQRETEAPEGDSPYGRLFRRITGKGETPVVEQQTQSSPPLEGGRPFSEKDSKEKVEGAPEMVITERSVSRITNAERENG